jgi:hypothetical protein
VLCSTITFCCSLDFRLPADCACLRKRCTESITSLGWARNALPSCCTQSGFEAIVSSTCGNATSDCTLGSHGSDATAFTASSPLYCEFAFDHAAAAVTSCGNVDAISTWASSASG